MDFVKKYKFYIIGAIVVGALLLLGFGFWNLFFNNGGNLYGNRLDGIEKVTISNDMVNKIKTELGKNEKINSIEYHLSGRIINFIIDVKKDTDLITATGFADKLLLYLTDAEKNYYDIQVFLTCEEDLESTLYPYIGSKHKTSVGFKWNNNE